MNIQNKKNIFNLKFKTIALTLAFVLLIFSSVVSAQTTTPIVKNTLTCTSTPCTKTQADIPFNSDHVYYIQGDLNISGNNDGTGSGVVFVEGNLNFTGDYTYGTPLTGAVFIVKRDINIAPTFTRIDAVLIAEGSIHTAAEANGTCLKNSVSEKSPGLPIEPLTINGSLISLNPTNPPVFCRTLSDNSLPAEVINHQVKYLVILRELMSDTLQRWSEIP